MSDKHRSPWPIIAGFLLIACCGVAFFIKALLHPENILNFSDVIHVWYFLKTFTVNSFFETGQLPLWNPLIYAGVPFVGNPQSTLFYPPFLLFFVMPVHFAITLLFAAHLIWAGWGMFVFARMRGISFTAALFAALVFMLNWKITGHIFAGHLTQTVAWSFMPWLLICIDYFVHHRSLRAVWLLALCIALIFFTGHMQLFYYHIMIGSAYLLFLSVQDFKVGAVGIVIGYGICVGVAVALMAISLLPVLEVSDYFHRAGGTDYQFATSFSLQMSDLIGMIMPYFKVIPSPGSNLENKFFWETAVYFGIAPLLMMLVANRRSERGHVIFFILVAIFALLFSLGSNGPLYRLMYYAVPGVAYFRVPARMFLYCGFVVALFAGFALQNILDSHQDSRLRPLARITLLGATALAILHEVYYYLLHKSLGNNSGRTILICFLFGILLLLFSRGILKKGFFIVALFALTLYDLGTLAWPLIQTKPLHSLVPRSPIYSAVINDPTRFRIFDTTGIFPQYLGAYFDVEKIGGDEPIMLASYIQYIQNAYQYLMDEERTAGHTLSSFPVGNLTKAIDWNAFHLLNVKYFYSYSKLDEPFLIEDEAIDLSFYTDTQFDMMLVPRDGYMLRNLLKVRLYRNTNVFPRGFLLPAGTYESIDDALDEFLIDTDAQVTPAIVVSYEPNRIEFQVDSDTNAYLITGEIAYPGWSMEIDGVETEWVTVRNLLRAAVVPKGMHQVVFTYRPASYELGKLITAGGIALLVVIGILGRSPSKYTKK